MNGYYRFPTVHGSDVVFVSEDDLWHVPLEGGIARRITSGRGAASHPRFSPDGEEIAFTATEEGTTEVFRVPGKGGPPTQLTWLGANTATVGWDGEAILFRSTHAQPFRRPSTVFSVARGGGEPRNLGLGSAAELVHGPNGARALSRNSDDLARWKRYRGGTAAVLWLDRGDGEWHRLFEDERAGHCRPMFVGERLYFVTDRDGCGNLWSCDLGGEDVRQETTFEGFYVRFPTTDGTTIVFCGGGDLYRFVPGGEAAPIKVEYASPRTQLQRRFVDAEDYLDDVAIHPRGHSLAVTSRGKLFNFGLWEGAVRQTGASQGVRYRLPLYLDDDGETLLVLSDEGGEERFEVHSVNGRSQDVLEVNGVDDFGRITEVVNNPVDSRVAFSNNRHELFVLDTETGEAAKVAKSDYTEISGFDWSGDGRWLAYPLSQGMRTSVIRIWDSESGESRDVTEGAYNDAPVAFDPNGKYLYFLSSRFFEPVYDEMFFDINFPRATRPCVVTLQSDIDSPFFEEPRPLEDDGGDDGDEETKEDDEASSENADAEDQEAAKESDAGATDEVDGKTNGEDAGDGDGDDEDEKPDPVEIDFEGIAGRIEAFDAPTGRYGQIAATDKKVFWTFFPRTSKGSTKGVVKAYDLKEREAKTFATRVWGFELSPDRKTIALWGEGLQLASTSGSGPDDDDDEPPSRKNGWIDLDRLSVEVDPTREWRQMLREAWRLMRDHFWEPKLAGVDWDAVWERYSSLLDRVGSRGEFSDLVWCMQGELGTSHAYEIGGDYRSPPRYRPGFLGADLVWEPDFEHDGQKGGFRIDRIVHGEGWKKGAGSPLARPGAEVSKGNHIVAINGRRLSEGDAIQRLLVNEAGREIELVVVEEGEARDVTVEALRSEKSARYREWVEANRRRVHEASDGALGYVHIPDMSANGYAEFHRSYFSEHERKGLVVDVRNNEGGHVSQLILEKLARKRIGYDISRYGVPRPYPDDSVLGPLVAVTDEHAGSDGDIFSHGFKLMDLGPLIGKRTWGGVVGIWPRHGLVDGSVTTQPEFSFWFEDVGFDVENYGTDPDLVVELEPESATGVEDAQLNTAIETAMKLLETQKPTLPEFDQG